MSTAPERALTFVLSATLLLTTLTLILLVGTHLGRPLSNLVIHLFETSQVVPLGNPVVTDSRRRRAARVVGATSLLLVWTAAGIHEAASWRGGEGAVVQGVIWSAVAAVGFSGW
ncbi:hypothetical protein Tdes44962_MAKER07104 [Teratosphaeria destructans]|uniref:Uncharacterized protein n=1 Tax=Teratosphaeria destructans TaxID=418781 RepID=A0A9W7W670_9PEZI|nr:hypothetical protein Tdes44962_MAKER07104 [Teratosphaeria destructans]